MEDIYTIQSLNLTRDELHEIEDARKKHVDKHDLCGGLGTVLNNGRIEDCVCIRSLNVYKMLVFARIPKKFRLLNLKCGAVNSLVHGKGRTSALVSELKKSLVAGERAAYCTARELQRWCRDDNQVMLERLRGCLVVAVDDLDRLSPERDQEAAPSFLRTHIRDQGVRLIGAGKPEDGWDLFDEIESVQWYGEQNLSFYDLAK